MPRLLNASSVLMCPHGGTVTVESTNTRVKAGGDFAATSADSFSIAGCTLNVSGSPHPCVTVQWTDTAHRSSVDGSPTLHETSTGMCVAADQAVQGTVQIVATQPRVSCE